jgi:hypothetical protein
MRDNGEPTSRLPGVVRHHGRQIDVADVGNLRHPADRLRRHVHRAAVAGMLSQAVADSL